MSTPFAPEEMTTLRLQIVERQTDGGDHRVRDVFLILRQGRPVKLGSGRYAYVVAAAGAGDVKAAEEFFALKFLKLDRDSTSVSKNSRTRFFEELDKTVTFRSAKQGLVHYLGFSRVQDPPQFALGKSGERERNEIAFEQNFAEQLKQTVKVNQAACEGIADFVAEVQGDFYAMLAEQGTLEDFLFDTHPWGQRAIFSVRAALRSELDDLVKRRQPDIEEFMADLRNPRRLAEIAPRDGNRPTPPGAMRGPSDPSGMEILNYIGRLSPTVKNAMVVDLASRVVRTIGVLHRGGGEGDQSPAEGWLAHRDLKPGNFLLSYDFTNEHSTLKVSDLGYVAGTNVAASLVHSAAGAVREPSVLAPGSYLFRPPEQIVPSIEIRFQILDAAAGTLRFTDVAGVVAPQVGDFLECQEIKFCGRPREGQKAAPGPAAKTFHKTKVAGVSVAGDYVTVTTEDIISSDRQHGDEYYLGWVIRPSGQHTDLFALGAMIYLFASGGKNPERFYMKCLEGFVRPRAQADRWMQPQNFGQLCHAMLYESCFSLALSLCVDDTEFLAQDLAMYLDDKTPPLDYLAHCQRLRPDVADRYCAMRGIKRKWKPFWPGGAPDPEVQLQQYLQVHRESPTVQHHLRDTNEAPIPFPIVYEAIRCMVRDKADSYVRRTDFEKQSYMDVDCHETASVVERQLGRILRECPSAKPNLASWANLGSPSGLFFLSRLCHTGSVITSSPSVPPPVVPVPPGPVAHAPGAAAVTPVPAPGVVAKVGG